MRFPSSYCVLGLVLLQLTTVCVVAEDASPRSRQFRFDYGGSVKNLPAGANVRVWLPIPKTDRDQKITRLPSSLPAKASTHVERRYGNKILYFAMKSPANGRFQFRTSYRVHRNEVRSLSGAGQKRPLSAEQRKLFLSSNEKVPLVGKQLGLIEKLKLPSDPLAVARVLYNRVDDHVRYDKSEPGYGNGDVAWVCDSRFGNCTDFHSLFISLSRARGLPSRFEIGFPLPPRRGTGKVSGYHCWALFHTRDRGWVPVDISEADKHPSMKQYYFGNLTEDRIAFTTGRDIKLQPPQQGPPLNYFVYPYVEVDGKIWPKKNIGLSFSYRDEAS